MFLVFGTTMLTARVVHSMYINPKKKTTSENQDSVWHKPSTWFLPPKITETTTYILKIEYVREDGSTSVFTRESTDYNQQQATAQDILKQIKMQVDVNNQEMIDKLFEDAVKEAK